MMILMYGFLLMQTFYWLALATWFGGVLFVALMAPVIFRVVRDSNPILPHVLSVNLENEHGSLLAGSIVGGILQALGQVQYICAGVMAIMLIGQWILMEHSWIQVTMAVIRTTLFVGAVALVMYDRYLVWPRAWSARQDYIDHADEPELANPAKDRFDQHHRESVRVLFIVLAMLSLIIVFSSAITPRL
jgi:hypothetical protein